MKNIVFDKSLIVDKIKKNGLSLDDVIGTLRSGAYIYQFEYGYAILSCNTIENFGKGYLFNDKQEFEKMLEEESFPQIQNGREDIFEIHRSNLENCELYTNSLQLKWPVFFNNDSLVVEQLCDSICKEIASNYKQINLSELFEKIMLLMEVFRKQNGYTWSTRKVYGEYTFYYFPIIKNKDKELGLDSIANSIYEGESWSKIINGLKFSLTAVSWIK